MEIKKINVAIRDPRGIITDVIVNTPIEHVTIISSVKGSVRGNHYHKDTIQWVYLQSGKLKSLTHKEGESVYAIVLEPGDLIMAEPYECHSLEALEDSVFLVLTRGPRGGGDYEKDTYRLATPLKEA
jgi:quercetin dioxygenase-like cupin family protein